MYIMCVLRARGVLHHGQIQGTRSQVDTPLIFDYARFLAEIYRRLRLPKRMCGVVRYCMCVQYARRGTGR